MAGLSDDDDDDDDDERLIFILALLYELKALKLRKENLRSLAVLSTHSDTVVTVM